jgi:hypothetical protein
MELLLMVQKSGIPLGSDHSSGTYECDDCGYIYKNQSQTSIPPCPESNKKDGKKHTKNTWTALSGQGDAPEDPYPNE